MKIVVTGGSGQLGSFVIEELLPDHEVVSVDIRSPSFGGHQHHLKSDIRDLEAMKKASRGADAVIHLAAQVSVVRSTEDPAFDMDVNVGGTISMLSAAHREGVPLFIYVSTAAVYGDPISLPVGEDHPTTPKSFYGTSKLSGEHYVRAFKESMGLDHIIVRPFNLYSPRADPSSPYSGVITRFIESARTGTPLRIEGDGDQTRDFIHARDVARMLVMCLGSRARNLTMNCASGRGTTINELVETVTSASPNDVTVENVPSRIGDIYHSVGDDRMAREILGFVPTITLREGISDFFDP